MYLSLYMFVSLYDVYMFIVLLVSVDDISLYYGCLLYVELFITIVFMR